MISSLGAILVWKSDDDDDAAADDYDDDRKSDPYMSPSYAGDTKIHFACLSGKEIYIKQDVRNIILSNYKFQYCSLDFYQYISFQRRLY